MELDCDTERTDGVTLVSGQLRNERTTDRRVRLENRLDGPVLPPRRQKEPEPGWDRDGLTTVVPAGGRVVFGYACPAAAASPPASVEWVEAADTEREATAAGAIRRLGDARPPRAVVDGAHEPTTKPTARGSGGWETTSSTGADSANDGPEPATLQSAAEALLRPARQRVETVEALGAADVPTAADVLESGGGLAGMESTGRRLDEDARALRALAAEASALAARAEAATPPTATLRRLS